MCLVLGPSARAAYLRVDRDSAVLPHASARPGMPQSAQNTTTMRALFSFAHVCTHSDGSSMQQPALRVLTLHDAIELIEGISNLLCRHSASESQHAFAAISAHLASLR